MMRKFFGAMFATAFVLGAGACTVEQTEEGDLPNVDVQEGELPEYDVDPADVDVNWDTTTVRTPDVDVNSAPDTTGM